jgi:hypothetical protein
VTPEETTAAARRMILAAIDEQADDTMGIGEQLEPELGEDPSETDLDDAVAATRAEINDVRAALAARWAAPQRQHRPGFDRELSSTALDALDAAAEGERARVAQAAVKLATLAAPAPPVDEPPAHRVDEEPGYVGDGEPEYGWRAGCACGEVVAGPDEEIADSLLRLHILEATNG